MTIPAATPDMPDVELTHGVGALVLVLRDDRGRSLGTVLSPRAAELLAYELTTQAAQARQAMSRIHPPGVDQG